MRIFLLALSLLWCNVSWGQMIEFSSSSGNIEAQVIRATPNSTLLLAYTLNDSVVLTEVDTLGNVLWQKGLDFGPGIDHVTDLAFDANGTIIISGAFGNTQIGLCEGFLGSINPIIQQFNWSVQLSSFTGDNMIPLTIYIKGNNNILIGGFNKGAAHDAFLGEYHSTNGNEIWEKSYTNGSANAIYDLSFVNQKLYGTGRFSNSGSISSFRATSVEIDVANGNLSNENMLAIPASQIARMYTRGAMAHNNNLIVMMDADFSGTSLPNELGICSYQPSTDSYNFVTKYDFTGMNNLRSSTIKEFNNHYYLSGFSIAPQQIILMKTDTNGQVAWAKTINTTHSDLGNTSNSSIEIINGKIALFFHSNTYNSGNNTSAFLLFIDENGDPTGTQCPNILTNLSYSTSTIVTPSSTSLPTTSSNNVGSESVLSTSVVNHNSSAFYSFDSLHLPDTNLCNLDTLNYQLDPTFANYNWSNGVNGPNNIITAPGTYWVTANFANGCSISDTFNVSGQASAVLPLADTTICHSDTITMTAPSGYSYYNWSNGSNSQSTWGVAASTLFVEYGDLNSGCIIYDTVDIYGVPDLSMQLNDTSICAQSYSINVSNGATNCTYIWSHGQQDSIGTFSQSGTYSVTASVNGNCAQSAQFNLTLLSPPNLHIGSDIVLCGNDVAQVTATGDLNGLVWSNGATSTSISTQDTGWLWAEVTGANCTNRDSIFIRSDSAPTILLDSFVYACTAPVIVTAQIQNGNQQLWSNGSTSLSTSIHQSGWYQLTAWSALGCEGQAQVEVLIENNLQLEMLDEISICPGDEEIFWGTPNQLAIEYLWNDGIVGANRSFEETGVYTLWIGDTNTGCFDTDSIQVNVFPTIDSFIDDQIIGCYERPEFTIPVDHLSNIYVEGALSNEITLEEGDTLCFTVENSCYTQSKCVPVILESCDCEMHLANTHTTNLVNRGYLYYPQYLCDYKFFQFRIYDRWGKLIYISDDNDGAGWDGTYKGEVVPQDIYVWEILYREQEPEAKLKRKFGEVLFLIN